MKNNRKIIAVMLAVTAVMFSFTSCKEQSEIPDMEHTIVDVSAQIQYMSFEDTVAQSTHIARAIFTGGY